MLMPTMAMGMEAIDSRTEYIRTETLLQWTLLLLWQGVIKLWTMGTTLIKSQQSVEAAR